MKLNKRRIFILIYTLTIIGFLALPYYIFDGKLFIGGDDSRLLYVYPWEWLKNFAFYSWFHFSSVGTNNPNQTLLPFVFVWSGIKFIFHSPVVVDYLAFSLPLILGFIYFQKMMNKIIERNGKDYSFILYIGSLIYVLSPITIINQLSAFLYSVWLIALFPIIFYYFLRYFKTGNFLYVFINILWCIFLSLAISTIPWVLGLIIPILIALFAISPLFTRTDILLFVKRSTVFFGILILSQAFWLVSFILNIFFLAENSFFGNILSSQTKSTFAFTIYATASGNIFYPLLNHFHRQLPVDFDWSLKNVFLDFYDYTLILNSIYVIVLFLAVFNLKKFFSTAEKKYFIFFFTAFLFSLFLFTVNIGPLKEIFIFMGTIPGFVMFRNFYDKFALGYIFIYSIVISFGLILIARKYENLTKIVLPITFIVTIINLVPIKAIINKPIWTTENVHANITVPQEYFEFMEDMESILPKTTNILSLPFNIAGYTIIKEENSNNVFAGRSPVQLFTGINDLSGDLSFSNTDSEKFNRYIVERKYNQLNKFLHERNIGYVFVTNNIPGSIKSSYLFNSKVLHYQDERFLKAITNEKVLESSNGTYVLYKTKYDTSLFKSKEFTFTKINPVTYKIYLKNLSSPRELYFLDSFSNGWRLYPEHHQKVNTNPLSYFWKKDIAQNSHKPTSLYTNRWIIDPLEIKKGFPANYYKENSDGSIDTVMTLYFFPQNNFYFGTVISIFTVLGTVSYWTFNKNKNKKSKPQNKN